MWRPKLIIALSAAALVVALAGCSQASPPPPTTAATHPTTVTPIPGKTCAYTAVGTAAKPVSLPPTDDVANRGDMAVTMTLSGGVVNMTFDRAIAPCAVNSFESLAQQNYFDNTDCHRLVNSDSLSVLQCGDPTATGSGGPGYSFADELSGTEVYTRGIVAMANSGADTNGSQFFIVFADSQLTPDYTVLGWIADADSMKVIDAIATATGQTDGNGSKPASGGHIDTITVS